MITKVDITIRLSIVSEKSLEYMDVDHIVSNCDYDVSFADDESVITSTEIVDMEYPPTGEKK